MSTSSSPFRPAPAALQAGAVGGLTAGLAEGVMAGGGPLAVACVAGALSGIGLLAGGAAGAMALLHPPAWWRDQGAPWLARSGWRILGEGLGLTLLVVAAGAWWEHLFPSTPGLATAIAAALVAGGLTAGLALARANEGRRAPAALGLAAIAWLAYPPLRVVPLSATLPLGLGAVAAVAALVGGRRWALRVGLVAALLAAHAAWLLVFRLADHPEVRLAARERAPITGRLLAGATRALDGDGDGVPVLLGGGDCDDDDATVHPGARDVPGNGIDEDCEGGDELPPPPPPPPPPAPDPLEKAAAGPAPGKRWSFLLITLDTVRWDHVGAYGYKRPTTPNIDAFARTATLFERAWAQAPQTKASVPSMLTGRYFSEVFRSKDLWVKVRPENPMFPEALRDAGYMTHGVMSHFFFKPRFGCHKGFEEWDLSPWKDNHKDIGKKDTSTPVTDKAIAALERHAAADPEGARPLLLWAHYFDPHHPYVRHKDAPSFGGGRTDRYDAEIAHTDVHVGRLLEAASQGRWKDELVVIIHSDHGEGLGDKGYHYHGIHIYEDQLRVPLIVRLPGQPGRRVRTPVAILDIAPTILELAGGLTMSRPTAGVSLTPWLVGEPPDERPPVFSEMVKDSKHSSRKVMIEWPWKLHRSVTYGYDELFHLERDPAEAKNRRKKDVEVYDRLKSRLRRWMSAELQEVKPGVEGPALAGRGGDPG